MKDAEGIVHITRENAIKKIETFPTVNISDEDDFHWKFICLDRDDSGWSISLFGCYGISADKVTREDWLNSPGGRSSDFSQYNVIVFGDSLFN